MMRTVTGPFAVTLSFSIARGAFVAFVSAVLACAALIGLAGAGLAQAAPDPAAYLIQPVGSFHDGEAIARDGERWMVLWAGGDARANRLAPARVRVARVHDALTDADGQTTGQEVSVPVPADSRETPLMLLRGRALKRGALTVAQIESLGTDGRFEYVLRYAGRESRLETVCTAQAGASDAGTGSDESGLCRIEWIEGDTRQTLFELPASRPKGGAMPWAMGDDAVPQLLFAGDIDRDGRLDLLIDATDHYNVSKPTLFLSSVAGRGTFVRRVARYQSVGC